MRDRTVWQWQRECFFFSAEPAVRKTMNLAAADWLRTNGWNGDHDTVVLIHGYGGMDGSFPMVVLRDGKRDKRSFFFLFHFLALTYPLLPRASIVPLHNSFTIYDQLRFVPLCPWCNYAAHRYYYGWLIVLVRLLSFPFVPVHLAIFNSRCPRLRPFQWSGYSQMSALFTSSFLFSVFPTVVSVTWL